MKIKKNHKNEFGGAARAVEHSIGGMKRYRFLADRLRNHDFNLYDDVLEICSVLWNFNLKH